MKNMLKKRRSLKRFSACLTLLLLFTSLLTACSFSSGPAGGGTAVNVPVKVNSPQITVKARVGLRTIPATAFGLNTAVWDNNLLDPAVPGLLQQAGITLLRFPGGSTSDVYHWQTNSTTNHQGYVNPNNTFDAFMGLVQRIGAQALITVNYGTNIAGTDGGDPAEAAAWVYYANITRHYGIKYWEIGNEVYGNGSYSSKWEADLHAGKGAGSYGSNVLQFVHAMKAVDPTIKVGVSFTTPSLDGDTDMQDWDPTVLSIACAQIDFVDVHWYPQNTTGDPQQADAQLLASAGNIPQMIRQPQQDFAQYCGAHARDMQVFLGEVNTGNEGKQSVSLVNALFLSDTYMHWLEAGGANVSWWDLHNGIDLKGNYNAALYGSAMFSDHGILANGSCLSGQCEPSADEPFPPYYALRMLALLGKPGDEMVATTSQEHEISAHAVKQANGDLTVLLINRSPTTTFHMTLSLVGYAPAAHATKYLFGMQSTQITSQTISDHGSSLAQDLPPYSLTTIVFPPA